MFNVNMNVFSKSVSALKKLKPLLLGGTKTLTTSCPLAVKVAVCGSSGGVGQPLSLLLKMSPHVTELALYDIKDCEGVAVDLSHVNTKVKVTNFPKSSLIPEALEKKDIIVLVGGKTREKGMTRSDVFDANVSMTREIVDVMSKVAPCAMLCIFTNPVNSLVPFAGGLLTKAKVFDPRKLFGVTTVDSVRASTFAAELMCYDPTKLAIPVIGGHSGKTIVPIFSQSSLPIELPKDKLKALVERVQHGGEEVTAVKGKSATLAPAYALARFVFALCRAIKGEKNIVECAYVHSDLTDASYFSTPVILGPMGIKKNLGYGKITQEECCMVNTAVKELVKEIEIGTNFLEADKKKT